MLENLEPDNVLSEFHYKKKTGEDPPPPPPRQDEVPRQTEALSSSHVTSYITTKDHPLIGRKFCFGWTDLDNRNKMVHGVVSECKKNEQTEEAHSFRVTYDEQSRDLINLINNGAASLVPDSQMLPAALVRGGCIRFDQQFNSNPRFVDTQLGFKWNWITPDMRHEDFVENSDGIRMPRLTLIVRGYRLELNVGDSNIPGAGKGVFLSCRPLLTTARKWARLYSRPES